MDQGWIKLHRKSFKSQAWRNPELWHLWCYCLLKANRVEAWVSIKTGRGSTDVHVLPGQFIFGSRQAAGDLGQKLASVHRRLKKLKSMGNLILQPEQHYTLVTICNWESYQGVAVAGETQSETPMEHQRNTNGTPTEPNNKEEKEKKDEKKEDAVAFPTNLDTPEFKATWDEWHAYRRQAKLVKWAPITIDKALKRLADMGEAKAIAALNHSMTHGYAGVFSGDSGGGGDYDRSRPIQTQGIGTCAEDFTKGLWPDGQERTGT